MLFNFFSIDFESFGYFVKWNEDEENPVMKGNIQKNA
jgi:hypothetical protein